MGKIEHLKDQIRKEAAKNPKEFFPVDKLKERDFHRGRCKNCGRYFWSKNNDRKVCGEGRCSGGYSFIGNSPAEKKLDYTSTWTEFKDFMEKRGYTGINRYPVLARWRNDTEFVRASIYDFQPYVVSGEVEPPANPLVIPQPSLRFNDIENVGVTGAHYVLHNHIGQHAFETPENYDQSGYFQDMLEWLVKGLGIPEKKVVIHEDSWGGGGNLGVSLEFFVGGMELFNQVYMSYKVDESERGYIELDTKVLDMGMGHERITWLTQGTETSYQASMPYVVGKLIENTGIERDKELLRKFSVRSGELNIDEVENVESVWKDVADDLNVKSERLKEEVNTMAAIYSIADHTRALLFAFVDGALPSNTGEKHSLRAILRRALDFIDKYGWELELEEVMEWHAEELHQLFPELRDNLDQAKRIMRHEQKKHKEMMKKARKTIEGLKGSEIDEERLVELYDTHGISPELLKRSGVDVEVPQNFYSMVSEKHLRKGEERGGEETGFDLEGVEKTEKLFYDETAVDFKAEVVKILDRDDEKYVVLDRTCFYPTQGGQMSDRGTINGFKVSEAINEAGIILHKMKDFDFGERETVRGKINWDRRKQLMQHHTATHIINGAAAEILGDHISQAGAKKTEEKARLDITHYEKIDKTNLEKIEEVANRWIKEGLEVEKGTMKKSEAEMKYGFKIYQGGVPPGNELRIINIGDGKDVEACGGTHVENTEEVEEIVIVNSTKVQDGVVRLEFKSGRAAKDHRKFRKKKREELEEMIDIKGHTLDDLCEIFDVPADQIVNVVERFIEEWQDKKRRIERLEEYAGSEERGYEKRPRDPEDLFEEWKDQDKYIKSLEREICKKVVEKAKETNKDLFKERVPVEDIGTLTRAVKEIIEERNETAVYLRGEKAVIAGKGSNSEYDIVQEVKKEAEVVKESGAIVKGFNLR